MKIRITFDIGGSTTDLNVLNLFFPPKNEIITADISLKWKNPSGEEGYKITNAPVYEIDAEMKEMRKLYEC